jgi:hypothetical protein
MQDRGLLAGSNLGASIASRAEIHHRTYTSYRYTSTGVSSFEPFARSRIAAVTSGGQLARLPGALRDFDMALNHYARRAIVGLPSRSSSITSPARSARSQRLMALIGVWPHDRLVRC